MISILTNHPTFVIQHSNFISEFRYSNFEFLFVHGWCPHQSIQHSIPMHRDNICYPTSKFNFRISHSAFRISHFFYSHSIVAGGLLLISYTTRLMPFTSLIMRFDTCAKNSCGKWQKSAVIPSTEVTARKQTAFS